MSGSLTLVWVSHPDPGSYPVACVPFRGCLLTTQNRRKGVGSEGYTPIRKEWRPVKEEGGVGPDTVPSGPTRSSVTVGPGGPGPISPGVDSRRGVGASRGGPVRGCYPPSRLRVHPSTSQISG